MTEFDPGALERTLHRPDVSRTGKRIERPAGRTISGEAYSPVNTGAASANNSASVQPPLSAAPGSAYSSVSAAPPYHVQAAPRAMYGENDVPTAEQVRLSQTGSPMQDYGDALRSGHKKATFSDRQRAILMLAALLAAVAVICFTVSLVRVVAANGALRAVQEKHQQEANAYAAVVKEHLNRRSNSGYEDLIRKYARMYGLNPDFVSAVIKRESDYQARATSSAGARGLMQIMPVNVEWFSHKAGLDGCTADDLYDPEINIHLGCWYLHYLGEMFNYDPVLMVCSYHAGQGNVSSWLKNYSSDGKTLTIDEIPMNDTKTYAQRVVNSYAIYAQH